MSTLNGLINLRRPAATLGRSVLIFILGCTALALLPGCKDHNRAEAERAGTPAPNQRVPTPSGTYQ